MQKLHLVGLTTDQTGLILSARKGARSGGYTLVLDDALAQAVEDLRARQAEEAEEAGAGRSDRVESRLPVGEIQARLRRGRSLKDVAKDAGVEPEWVERFAAPVFAEQAGVIARVQSVFYKRARLGPSGLRVGDAVRRNLAERGVVMSPAEFDAAWRTHQRPDGRWIVTFGFTHRGAHKTLKFEVRPNGDIVASDQLTAQISFVAPPKRPTPRPRPAPAPPEDANAAKRAVVTSGFRPDPPVKAASRPGKEREKAAAAMNKAAARRAVETERAAGRKAREREQARARREREAAAEELRRSREIAAKAREAAAAARLAQAEQAEHERAAATVAAARQADRDAARRAARLKVKAASKTVAAKKAAGKAARAGSGTTSTGRSASVTTSSERRSGSASAPKPPRPSAAARVEAPPPRRVTESGPTTGDTPTAVRPTPADLPKHAAAPPARNTGAAAAERSSAPPARNTGAAAAERSSAPTTSSTDGAPSRRPVALPERRRAPAAGDPRAGESARPQFRSGSATPAGDGGPSGERPAEQRTEAPANGVAPRRPPGVRRTRPLRAD